MQKYICIHGHFYQPPRENAWLETVEVQDSAYPYHDWNERITAECYGPNAFARILDGQGRIARIVNNYSRISFNFGPTLLSWLADKSPKVYAAIIEADHLSRSRFSGHGSAIAQAYNHLILPLASKRDKYTQVIWGIYDFAHRFGRKPEGMWLPETAVDLETLEVLAEFGIRFTILSPYQAQSVREIGADAWQEVAGGHIDPTRAYVQRLPSGRSMNLFFYDGPISRAVAFERLLSRGETFVERLCSGFSDQRQWPQLMHIATDGESYGHHHSHGDMGLAFALQQIEDSQFATLTNYAEYLERHPPTHEVRIIENSSWSCAHGIERWRSDCGCNSGRPGWRQTWRGPMRKAFDWLRDAIARPFADHAKKLVRDPWKARDNYIAVILDRSPEASNRFIRDHARHPLDDAGSALLLKLLEMQRYSMLMYTSCGWFFDELSGIEPVQIIQYAGRVIQLAKELFGSDLEAGFLDLLEQAPSNLPELAHGRTVYERYVKPTMVGWPDVAAHYAVSSLFDAHPPQTRLFCFQAEQRDYRLFEAGKAKLCAGRVKLTSEITREAVELEFAAMHFGDHSVSGGVRYAPPLPPGERGEADDFETLLDEVHDAFARADFPTLVRVIDRGFGEADYSLRSLFRDQQRKIIARLLKPTLLEIEGTYRRQYQQHLPTMRFLQGLGMPLPRAFQMAIDFVVNADLRRAYDEPELNLDNIKELIGLAETWHVPIDTNALAYHLKNKLRDNADELRVSPDRLALLESLSRATEFVRALRFEVDLWHPQNTYYELLHTVYPEYEAKAIVGDENARLWIERFVPLGEKLGVDVGERQRLQH